MSHIPFSLFEQKMSGNLTTKEASHLLRRLHTLLVLGRRSNTLALAIRRALEEMRPWPQTLPFASHFVKRSPRLIFAGYGPKFIKMIQEMLDHGSISMLNTLQAEYSPFFCELCELPGIGETVARRMYYERMIESFEDLRVAFANNVLLGITGFGETRVRIIEAWILAKSEDPEVAACDIVLPEIVREGEPSFSSADQPDLDAERRHSGSFVADDYSEEDVFGNELDTALKADLASLPSLSFEAAKAACSPSPSSPPPASDASVSCVVFPQERVQRVSYLKASHVSQIDLQFSQSDTRTAHHASENRPLPSRSFADWAMTRCMPAAFMARFVAMMRLGGLCAGEDVLVIGNRMDGLLPTLAMQMRELGASCAIMTSAVCPEQGLFARIVVDPLLCLEMSVEQVKSVFSRLAVGGMFISALPIFSRIPGFPYAEDTVSVFHDAVGSVEGVSFQTESVDFMLICRFIRQTRSAGG